MEKKSDIFPYSVSKPKQCDWPYLDHKLRLVIINYFQYHLKQIYKENIPSVMCCIVADVNVLVNKGVNFCVTTLCIAVFSLPLLVDLGDW